MPRDLQRIGANAFFDCKKLKNVLFPGDNTEIGDYAFGFYQAVSEYGDNYIEKDSDFFMSGKDGSAAQQYAQEHAIPFTVLDSTVISGDVDGNGEINTADVLMIQKHLSKIIELNEEQKAAADTDGNGKIEMNDVLQIQKFLAKIIDVL